MLRQGSFEQMIERRPLEGNRSDPCARWRELARANPTIIRGFEDTFGLLAQIREGLDRGHFGFAG